MQGACLSARIAAELYSGSQEMAFEDAPSILHEASFVGTHARSISSFIPTLRDFLHFLQPKLAGIETFFSITVIFSHYPHFLRQTKPYGVGTPITRNMTATALSRLRRCLCQARLPIGS